MNPLNFPRYEEYIPSGFDWLGDIPSCWPLQRLGAVFEERKEKVSDKDFPPLSVTKVGILPQLDTAAKSDDGDNRKGVRAGDFVINSRSDRKGSSGIAKQDGSVSLINIVLKPKNIDPQYCEHLLKSNGFIEEFYRNGHGIVADLWTTKYWDMKSIFIPVPDMETQQRIANFLDQKTAEIDEAIAKKQRVIELLKEQKAILINQAVTKGLNPDAPMRDSGVEWIGEVPAHWEVKRLRYLANLLQTGPFGSQLHQEEYIAGGIPVINPSQLINGQIIPDPQTSVSDKTAKRLQRHMTKVGDIIFARRGEMGRCGLTREDQEGYICGTGSILFRPNNFAQPLFLNIALGCDFTKQYLQYVSVGATMDNLNTSILSKMALPVPPKEEQSLIVDAVSQIEEEHQKVSKSLLNGINQLQELKQSTISSAVTGKIKL